MVTRGNENLYVNSRHIVKSPLSSHVSTKDLNMLEEKASCEGKAFLEVAREHPCLPR
jgi:hypothetical protein